MDANFTMYSYKYKSHYVWDPKVILILVLYVDINQSKSGMVARDMADGKRNTVYYANAVS